MTNPQCGKTLHFELSPKIEGSFSNEDTCCGMSLWGDFHSCLVSIEKEIKVILYNGTQIVKRTRQWYLFFLPLSNTLLNALALAIF